MRGLVWRGGLPPLGRAAAPSVHSDKSNCLDLRLLRSRTGASPLVTGCVRHRVFTTFKIYVKAARERSLAAISRPFAYAR